MQDRVRRYQEATAALDFDTLGELRHPDYVCTYPQSGERFRGHDNWAAAHADYTSHFGREHLAEVKVSGGERQSKVSTAPSVLPFASTPIIQISDSGRCVTLEGTGRWPDGKVYHWVQILEYKDGLVWRETGYFAEPFEAPEWRAPWTEPITD